MATHERPARVAEEFRHELAEVKVGDQVDCYELEEIRQSLE